MFSLQIGGAQAPIYLDEFSFSWQPAFLGADLPYHLCKIPPVDLSKAQWEVAIP